MHFLASQFTLLRRGQNFMKKPIGVIIAGIILLACGLFGLLSSGLGILGMAFMPSAQMAAIPTDRIIIFATEFIFAAISVFYCWVAIDLFRMRSWARYATIVLAVLGAFVCGISAVAMTLLQNIAPPVPNLPPELLHRILLGLAVVYFLMAAIAVFWVIYFSLKPTRLAFATAAAQRQSYLA